MPCHSRTAIGAAHAGTAIRPGHSRAAIGAMHAGTAIRPSHAGSSMERADNMQAGTNGTFYMRDGRTVTMPHKCEGAIWIDLNCRFYGSWLSRTSPQPKLHPLSWIIRSPPKPRP